ncbi:MAG: hypothetical protein WEA09_07550 [Gemmatimonadota bacterium]
MTHPEEGELLALLDGEAGTGPVEGHVEACATCRTAMNRLRIQRQRVSAALEVLEAGFPSPDGLERIRARAAGDSAGAPADAGGAGGRGGGWWFRAVPLGRAAIFFLLLAGTASAALPGSPVRDLLRAVWGDDSPTGGMASTDTSVGGVEILDRASVSQGDGVWLALPPEGDMDVIFTGPVGDPGIRMVVVDGGRVGAFARGPAEFRTGARALAVELNGGGAEAHLPRSAAVLRVRLDDRILMRLEDGVVEVAAGLVQLSDSVWLWPGRDP